MWVTVAGGDRGERAKHASGLKIEGDPHESVLVFIDHETMLRHDSNGRALEVNFGPRRQSGDRGVEIRDARNTLIEVGFRRFFARVEAEASDARIVFRRMAPAWGIFERDAAGEERSQRLQL